MVDSLMTAVDVKVNCGFCLMIIMYRAYCYFYTTKPLAV